jgi:thiol-disulfide isomerase/thioredoxin
MTGAIHLSKHTYGRTMATIGCGLSAIGFLLAAGSVVIWYQVAPALREQITEFDTEEHTEWVGVRAPHVTLKTLDGENISLADMKGRRIVVDVFRSWDPDCQDQIKSLNTLENEIRPDQVIIVGITTDTPEDMEQLEDNRPKYKVASVDALPSPFDETTWYPATFFIDRNGVFDAVTIDNQTVARLRQLVAAPDFPGAPIDAPKNTSLELIAANVSLVFGKAWSIDVDGAHALCVGDWEMDGTAEVLVVDRQPALHIIDAEGKELNSFPLPDEFQSASHIEVGRHKEHGARLLGLSQWGDAVHVTDSTGKEAWKYHSMLGIDGAHWGDIDGDGSDEMIAGMNGFSGLHAVSPDGKSLWAVRSIGNVWSQAVVSATATSPGRVFATEAGGQVYIYDKAGNKIRSIRPKGHYFATMTAAAIDKTGRIQILAIGDELGSERAKVLAFDERGFVAWASTFHPGANVMRSQAFASGDLNGDGTREWLLRDADEGLIAVSADGVRMGSIQPAGGIDCFGIVEREGGPATVVTLASEELTAFHVQSPTESLATGSNPEAPA